jgi:formamidopyrimidine-DNA glycosylase
MPELPEVEVVRRGLMSFALGRVIERAEVFHSRAVRRHLAGPDDFTANLTGRRFTEVARRGKYLWLPLADAAGPTGQALVAHLGMSGQLLMADAARPDEAHLRVRVCFADGDPELRFVDQRTFGALFVEDMSGDASSHDAAVPMSIAHIARDVLDPRFDDEAFHTALRARHTELKRALLDQTLVSGIGNIYADEALWLARLNYSRPAPSMRRPLTARLLVAVRAVMSDALAAGGTSFDSLYVNVNGQSGYFDRSLRAYGRAGQPCGRCGTPISRVSFTNRSSYFCPRCQPLPKSSAGT